MKYQLGVHIVQDIREKLEEQGEERAILALRHWLRGQLLIPFSHCSSIVGQIAEEESAMREPQLVDDHVAQYQVFKV